MKIELLGTERRRRWSLQDKLQIVEETLQPFLGEHDRFSLVGRIKDEALLVEPVCCAPVKTLPGSAPIVQRQPHQGEHGLIDLVVVDLHAATLPRHDQRSRGLRRMLTDNDALLREYRERLAERTGVTVCLAVICEALKRLKLRPKKRPFGRPSRSGPRLPPSVRLIASR